MARDKVFFDFDNTITPFDILDDIIERFSVDRSWVKFEQLWKKGKIGSKKCLQGQLSSVRITKGSLEKYLSTIKVDPCFKRLFLLLKRRGVRPVILSDNFSFIIKYILRNNGIRGLRVYSNSLKFDKDRLLVSFPHTNISCFRCGHCKKNNLPGSNFRDKIVYIGDGLSDICPAESSDIVFAKGSLLKHFKQNKISCIPFKDLSGVYRYFKEGKLDEPKTKNL